MKYMKLAVTSNLVILIATAQAAVGSSSAGFPEEVLIVPVPTQELVKKNHSVPEWSDRLGSGDAQLSDTKNEAQAIVEEAPNMQNIGLVASGLSVQPASKIDHEEVRPQPQKILLSTLQDRKNAPAFQSTGTLVSSVEKSVPPALDVESRKASDQIFAAGQGEQSPKSVVSEVSGSSFGLSRKSSVIDSLDFRKSIEADIASKAQKLGKEQRGVFARMRRWFKSYDDMDDMQRVYKKIRELEVKRIEADKVNTHFDNLLEEQELHDFGGVAEGVEDVQDLTERNTRNITALTKLIVAYEDLYMLYAQYKICNDLMHKEGLSTIYVMVYQDIHVMLSQQKHEQKKKIEQLEGWYKLLIQQEFSKSSYEEFDAKVHSIMKPRVNAQAFIDELNEVSAIIDLNSELEKNVSLPMQTISESLRHDHSTHEVDYAVMVQTVKELKVKIEAIKKEVKSLVKQMTTKGVASLHAAMKEKQERFAQVVIEIESCFKVVEDQAIVYAERKVDLDRAIHGVINLEEIKQEMSKMYEENRRRVEWTTRT